jgi:hypothetical protein
MSRLGWIVFAPGTDMTAALAQLDNAKMGEYILHVAPQTLFAPRVRLIPSEAGTIERLKHDNEQIRNLAEHVDGECEITSLPLLQSRLTEVILKDVTDEIVKVKKSVDLHIAYLNYVHQYDYYSGVESSSPEDHARYDRLTKSRTTIASEHSCPSRP